MSNEEKYKEVFDIEDELYYVHYMGGEAEPYVTDVNVHGKVITFEINCLIATISSFLYFS